MRVLADIKITISLPNGSIIRYCYEQRQQTNHESNSWGRITAAAVAAASDIGSNAATVNRSVSNELVLGTQ